MRSRRMPFRAVPCAIWLPHEGERDAYGNRNVTYSENPDIETTCCYAPGRSKPDTGDEIGEERPHGDYATLTFYLPKTVSARLRGARIACPGCPDPVVAGLTFDVVGDPTSYMRENTPGDYSWSVEGVEHVG